jgi:uncharacterized membrane protein YkvI
MNLIRILIKWGIIVLILLYICDKLHWKEVSEVIKMITAIASIIVALFVMITLGRESKQAKKSIERERR